MVIPELIGRVYGVDYTKFYVLHNPIRTKTNWEDGPVIVGFA